MTLWGKPERQHVQDLEQLHAHTVNRMSLSVAQPQATEQREKYTMHIHNTADTSTRAQHRYKYICTTQVRVHMYNTGTSTYAQHVATRTVGQAS